MSEDPPGHVSALFPPLEIRRTKVNALVDPGIDRGHVDAVWSDVRKRQHSPLGTAFHCRILSGTIIPLRRI